MSRTLHVSAFAGCVPVPLARPRFDGRTRRTYTSDKSEAGARVQALLFAPHTPREKIGGPIGVRLYYTLPLPKKGREPGPHCTRPDVDNLAKLTLDVLSRLGWWADDWQVAELHATKRWGLEPGVRVEVWGLS